ncbi:MAG: hypothetical protein J7623_27710 [Chitinophaga sp.]|uniref:hypothetical protein n=1 Tax=Chitinophaga sp. TaxID=1869181 RepID=UPI001B16B5A6|nr:hypothetical protein [Chitinophaga sp.]MBO9732460.1 hypothetical protein [Chitinophaga sp.]
MKKRNLLLLVLPVVFSCKPRVPQVPLPKVLEKNYGFDIEKITFNEDVPTLYSKHVMGEEIEYDSARDGKITDTTFKYQISNTITDVMKFRMPQKDFGYLYKSPEIDSIAKFGNVYFNTLYTLTDTSRKPVAFYAAATFDSARLRAHFLDEFRKKYGPPKYSFYISNEFNHCSYEWDLSDRTIQIETSFGFEASFNSNGKSKSGKYYRLDMLVMNNKHKDEIYKAHLMDVPEKIMYDGKLRSYKDFQFEKVMLVKDEFYLFSTNEALIKNEYGEYSIENAEADE